MSNEKQNNQLGAINLKAFFIWLILFFIPIANITYAMLKDPTNDRLFHAKSLDFTYQGLEIKSVDTQIISKHWGSLDQAKIADQVLMIKNLGANYIAISTPYDHQEIIKIWANEIHRAGLNVWFRSHWLRWEGDDGLPSDMSKSEYLAQTRNFILDNQELFKEGDSFTVCVEPEQVYVARNLTISDWKGYNKFIIDQMDVADQAFSEIGLEDKIHTNWISMNGWVVEHGLEQETVDRMGLITIDHYPDQDRQMGAIERADRLANDLQKVYKKWQKPIILGEWGFNILNEVSDGEQKEVLSYTFGRLKEMPFVIGINYWSHLGNTSRIIDDTEGRNLLYRPAAFTLKEYFLGQ